MRARVRVRVRIGVRVRVRASCWDERSGEGEGEGEGEGPGVLLRCLELGLEGLLLLALVVRGRVLAAIGEGREHAVVHVVVRVGPVADR